MQNDMQNIFQSLRNEFIIIGLTGALGSGCTTSANFLSGKYSNLNHFFSSTNVDEFNLDYRKNLRVQQYYENNDWESFFHIRVSDILLLIMLRQIDSFDNFPMINEFDNKTDSQDTIKVFFKDMDKEAFQNIKKTSETFFDLLNEEPKDITMSDVLSEIKKFIDQYIDKKDNTYTKIFQLIGENLRTTGRIYNINSKYIFSKEIPTYDINNLPIFIIPEIIRRTIKYLNRKEKCKFFTIDALRNIYEIEFFRNRYQSFYLFSILANEEIRQKRLYDNFSVNKKNLEDIKTYETSNKEIEHQAINKCIGKGDIFINNSTNISSHTELNIDLLRYIALIRRPGLFVPSNDERFMQVAFTARYNSGCISRQVGAVVTGKDGYIRGFGWNDVPEDHVPCLYRTPQQLLDNSTNQIFSAYERSDTFFQHIENLPSNQKNQPFCFKDNQNSIESAEKKIKIYKEIEKLSKVPNIDVEKISGYIDSMEFKNPTRERALHAEENSFLQITKSGGQGVVGGTLYTTDSPCQLCAKKAMQLKIKRIVYIDAYPDISEKHTLNAGIEEEWPDLDMFNGVLGAAYFKLYVPIIGIKDEIRFISNVKKETIC